jgi:hypothetical protein
MGTVCAKSSESEPVIERENSKGLRIATNIRTRPASVDDTEAEKINEIK